LNLQGPYYNPIYNFFLKLISYYAFGFELIKKTSHGKRRGCEEAPNSFAMLTPTLFESVLLHIAIQ
jgi:hypothetical protein